MMCVETINYFVLVNKEYAVPIQPRRDLRQGDPLYICSVFALKVFALIQRC